MHSKHRVSRAGKFGVQILAGSTAPLGPCQHGVETSPREAARGGAQGKSAPNLPRPARLARLLPRGIRERLFLLIALALLPAFVLQGMISFQHYSTRRSQALQMELEAAEGVATTFSAYTNGVRRQLDTVGQAIITLSPYDEAQAERVLNILAAQYTTIRHMYWVSLEGIILASSQPGLVGYDLSGRPYFQKLLAGRPWVISNLTPQGAVVFVPNFFIATAVRDASDRLQGVVVANIDPARLGELTLTQERLEGGEYAIFDRRGRLVYQNPETPLTWEQRLQPAQSDPLLAQALQGESVLGEMAPDAEDGQHLAARVPIADTGWVAGAARPVKLVLAPVWHGLLDDALLATMTTSLAFLLAYLLARTIAGPLLRLEEDAQAMGEARIDAPADAEAPREVRSLRATVAHMAADLLRRAEALRQSEQRFQAVLENSLDAAYRRDLRRDLYEYLSPVIEQIVGFSSREMNKLPVEQVLARIHPDDMERVRRELAEAEATGMGTIEYRFQCKDGTYRWLADYFVVQKDEEGRPLYYNGSVRNITGLKQAEEALHDLTKTLEMKVAQRTAELRHRARQLQQLTLEMSEAEDRERRRMAEILHDDLQQVLAAAKFHLSLVRNGVKHDPSLREITGEIDHMLKDAVEKSRSLSHELSPAIMHLGDFGETLRWLADEVRTKHGLLVQVRGRMLVESDGLKAFLYRSVQELLFNVVKHARVKEAAIRVRRLRRYLCLKVSDRGRGFDPQELQEAAGFGLLSIRERIELLGGRMRIKSAEGQGSAFFIVVPDSPKAQDMAGTGPRAHPALAAPGNYGGRKDGHGGPVVRVLLADDHEIVRQGLVSLLIEEPSIEIVGEAANGREAVNLADRLKPDVVVMDVSMPLMDGYEATRQIKAHLPQMRIVALSMYNEPEAMENMQRAGAEGYVLKTAPLDELLAAIRGESETPDAVPCEATA
jgi:PAS domain S-box-containing protein